MHDLRRLEDRPAARGVAAPLDPPAAHHVHRPSQDPLQFVLHVDVVKEAPRRVRCERHQHVDIAVGTEILAQHGAEEGELGDLPAAAEVRDAFFRDIDPWPVSHSQLPLQEIILPDPSQPRLSRAEIAQGAPVLAAPTDPRTESMTSAASRWRSGRTWLYVSSVRPTVAWPSRSETTLGCTPARSMSVAAVWRRSWSRRRGRPAFATIRSKARLRLRSSRAFPVGPAKTSP